MKKSTPHSYQPSAEDRALFRKAVAAIRPNHLAQKAKAEKLLASVAETQMRDYWPETVGAEEKLFYAKPGVPKNMIRRLKRSEFPHQAILDLHGLTVKQASQELMHFLTQAVKDNCQCVRIVHGKNKYAEPMPPILKNCINGWLQQHPAVLAFCSALPKHGSTGAVYVLLRHHE